MSGTGPLPGRVIFVIGVEAISTLLLRNGSTRLMAGAVRRTGRY